MYHSFATLPIDQHLNDNGDYFRYLLCGSILIKESLVKLSSSLYPLAHFRGNFLWGWSYERLDCIADPKVFGCQEYSLRSIKCWFWSEVRIWFVGLGPCMTFHWSEIPVSRSLSSSRWHLRAALRPQYSPTSEQFLSRQSLNQTYHTPWVYKCRLCRDVTVWFVRFGP